MLHCVKVKECVAVPKSKKLLQFTLDDGTGVDRTILSGIHAYYEPEELVGKTLIAITKQRCTRGTNKIKKKR
jgi:tRNA-binding EMAP/Myf-like protein